MNVRERFLTHKERIDDLPALLSKMSSLLNEGYKLNESFIMLLPYYSKNAESWQKKVTDCLHNGLEASEVFKLLKVDDEFLISIQLADRHGDLATTLKQVSEQMHYKKEMQKRMLKILAYPLFMFLILVAFFFGFRTYFLPNISHLVTSRSDDASNSIQWSKFFLHMPDYFITLGIILNVAIAVLVYYLRKKKVEFQLNFIFKLPFVGTFYRLLLTRQFARNLGNLLLTGFTLQQALFELKSQVFQKNIQFVAVKMEQKIIYGDSLTESIQKLPYFYPKFEQFVDHGEKSGLLGRELLIYCDILDGKLKNTTEFVSACIQPLLFIIIATCIVAAYLSILLPMYKMIEVV